MKKTALLSLTLLFAVGALAQMHGGMPGMPGSGNGNGNGTGTMMQRLGAMAMPHFEVAADGTVITVQRGEIVAYTANGTKAWTYELEDNAMNPVRVAGTLVLVGGNKTLTALNVSNGAKAWTLALDGYAMHVEPAATQIYVMVVKVEGTTLTRTLLAVSNSGTVLWRQTL